MIKVKNITILLFGIAFISALLYGLRKDGEKNVTISDTTTVVVYDTVSYYKPMAKDSIVIRYKTERVPIYVEDSISGEKEICDSVDVKLPITQKVYKDSSYTAYVSGYNPSLDSLFVYPKHEVKTIKIYQKHQRWNVGLHVGYGLVSTNTPQFAAYIGIGISYKLFEL